MVLKLSMYKSEHRTNNLCEGFHSALKRSFQSPHPHLWEFLDKLNVVIGTSELNVKRIQLGQTIQATKRRCWNSNDKRIRTATIKLDDGFFSPIEFINAVSKMFRSQSDVAPNTNEENDDSISDDEEGVSNIPTEDLFFKEVWPSFRVFLL